MASPQHTTFTGIVIGTQWLSRHLVRVSLGGSGLEGFTSSGYPDEWVGIGLPDADETVVNRTYTVRRFDAANRRLEIDFVIHGDGIASRWAASAQPGDTLPITAPHGRFALPADAEWLLAATDYTGLPALARILEELPPRVHVTGFIETFEPTDVLDMPTAANLDLTWLPGSGLGNSPSRLEQVVRDAATPSTPGYIWAAGEAGAIRNVRKYLRHELGLLPDRYHAVGYWREDADAWFSAYQQLDFDLGTFYEQAIRDGKDDEQIRDEVDAILERAGL